jgi:hypothetical protein
MIRENPETTRKGKVNKFCSGANGTDHLLLFRQGRYPHSFEFTPSSMNTDETIQLLQEQIARMGDQIARLQHATHVDQDPQIQGQVAATTYFPSDREADRYPAIRPSDPLFLFKKDLTDEEFWEQLRKIPKNNAVGYEPPKVPAIIHNSTAEKNHDTQLRALQKRIAHLTRPVDLFLHQAWSMEGKESVDVEEMVEWCTTFGILMRDNLAAVAGRINTMRLDNLRATQGTTYKDDALHLVDPKQFQEEVKSYKALANAFKPRQSSSYQKDTKFNSDKRSTQRDSTPRDNFKHRDSNNDRRSSFRRERSKRRGDSRQRGRSRSRKNDRSPESGAGSRDS